MRVPAIFLLSSILSCNLAHADGLGDLKASLARLQGQSPLKAVLEAKTWRKLGEGSEAQEVSGHASVQLDDGAQGLQMLYSKEILQKIAQEGRAKSRDANSKTPTLAALTEFEASQVREMTSAAAVLGNRLDKAIFKSEKADSYNGKPARLLSFEIAADSLSESQRKYIKKFEGNLLIWIATDGTPLASRIIHYASGRAFIVISFEVRSEEQEIYAQSADRLLVVQKESKKSASGAGERSEEKASKSLQWQAM